MRGATEKLMVLTPNQARAAQCWYQFIGDIVAADRAMERKITQVSKPIVLNDRECSILARWWNYLPSNLVDPGDRDLYDTIRNFLFN
jgi:hypothetical protein